MGWGHAEMEPHCLGLGPRCSAAGCRIRKLSEPQFPQLDSNQVYTTELCARVCGEGRG